MDPVVSGILRALLVWVFGQAALHKLRDPSAFAGVVRAYRLVPDALAPAVAVLLGAVEVGLVAALLVPGLGIHAATLAATLLGVYSLAIGVNLVRGRRDVDCGCLGPGQRQPLSGGLLVRNGALVAAAVGVAVPVSDRGLGWLDGVTVLAGAAVLVLLFSASVRLGVRPAFASPGGRLS